MEHKKILLIEDDGMKYLLKIESENVVSYLLPITIWLSVFNTLFTGLTYGDILLGLLIFTCLLTDKKSKARKIETSLIQILFFHIILSLISLSFAPMVNIASVINRMVKFVYYVVATIILLPRINIKKTISVLESMTFMTGVGLLIQYIIYYYFGIINNIIKIPFLNYGYDYTTSAFNTIFRPSSFFLEPSHLTHFVIPVVIIELFRKDTDRAIYKAAIFSLVCLLTTSGTAIFLLSFVWIIYFGSKFITSLKSFISLVITMFILLTIIQIGIHRIPQLDFAVSRLLDFGSVVYTGRLNAGKVLAASLSGYERFIGLGFGNLNDFVYLNSVYYLFYSGGYILITGWLVFFIKQFLRGDIINKVICISFLALCFASRIFLSMYLLYYLALVILQNDKLMYYSVNSNFRSQ